MTSRNKIVSDIAEIIKDYKYLPESLDKTSNYSISCHVEKWISQFSVSEHNLILNHTYNILSKRYFSKNKYDSLLKGIARNKKNHGKFRKDCILTAQSHGESQTEINTKLNSFIKKEIDFELPIINVAEDNIDVSSFNWITYVDDFSFSAKLVGDDIENFIIKHKINNVKIRVLIFLFHTYGLYSLGNRLHSFAEKNKLNIEFYCNKRFWGDVNNDISEYHSHRSETYFPLEDSYNNILRDKKIENVEKFKASYFRVDSHDACILGDDTERNEIESIFTSKGFDIIANSAFPKPSMKPLGFSTFKGFGFGGNVFSYRNCPNNTPLVFWWGTYEKIGNKAIDCWYPLMKRNSNY